MPGGGRRPGAGAPRGNLNNVKDGTWSAQVKRALRSGSLHEWKRILERMKNIKDRRASPR
jgi:hypothetical protein